MSNVDDLFLAHIPLCAPRPDIPGEVIYLRLWQEFMHANSHALEDIVTSGLNGPIDQRVASVAASFMVYMGCNGGANFTRCANELVKRFDYPHEAFLAAFVIENQRRRSVNHGLRKVEYMLAAEHPIVDGLFSTRVEWERVPDISQRDLDVIECMVIWWSTPQAERLRRVAEPLIEAEQRKAGSRLFAAPAADAPDASLHATHM
ncbi:hypothetical protein WT83_27415 [Burkholderia territorii]|uniref:Uncharacterized protein n=1 Tax=Burkholderia territorii TaxID=1503055 RepID=A0A108E825_9BURK|nr:hypothetical protein [Burkholderia territorii]KWN06414.1 hypothetical protein WT83_27415 [Burkholderia territorii]